MEASPSRRDSFSRGAPSFGRLDVHAALGESFTSSTASFIDMDPEEELFSMRWTSDDFAPPCARAACSPLLASAGLVFCDEGLLRPCEDPSGTAAIDADGIAYGYADDASAASSPAFHTARSTPAASVAGSSRRREGGGAAKPLLATRRLLLRYLRFLAPLCRKARSLRAPARAFSAPRARSLSLAAATPARRSTSSAASAAEHWCHGNADTAVHDAILHCKKSLLTARTEC
ncbi:unnamed protein product [Urochloa humidicola]